jgi:hypothetical protein
VLCTWALPPPHLEEARLLFESVSSASMAHSGTVAGVHSIVTPTLEQVPQSCEHALQSVQENPHDPIIS